MKSLLALGNPQAARYRHGYVWAIIACALTTLLALPLSRYLDLSNIVMLFLLAVLLIAVRFGRGPAVLASFLSVALFDFFLVPPRLSFAVNDAQYLITFAVMLAVALLTGQLTAGLRQQVALAALKHQQTQALYEMARDLAGAISPQQVAAIVRQFLFHSFALDAILLLPNSSGDLTPVPASDDAFKIEMRFALIVFEQGGEVEDDSLSGYGFGASYFALTAPMRTRGVIVVAPKVPNRPAMQEHKPLLVTLSSLVAIAVERLHYVEVAHAAQLEMVSERLRSSILSALSHDLRTPLTALVGLAESLTLSKQALPQPALDTAEALREQALRLSSLVSNLLDMARLHAGRVKLRKEWQPLEEVIGASIQLLGRTLAAYPIRVNLAPQLPLLEFDAVLMERVFCNLLENSAKYAPPDTSIEITALVRENYVEITLSDAGPGFPNGQQEALFDMFVRGVPESAAPGAGLGLAICRAIIEAHGGNIFATNRPDGGACVAFTLPTGDPPNIEMDPVHHENGHHA